MQDFAHELIIPLVPLMTAIETCHSEAVLVPDVIWDACGAWQNIKDEEEASRVGRNIQERINLFYGQDKRDTGLESQGPDLPTS